MQVKIHRSEHRRDRRVADHDWLKARHAFSLASLLQSRRNAAAISDLEEVCIQMVERSDHMYVEVPMI